ncbi:MAG: hypothetical protein ACLFP1_09560 [Candidatus Goldiibacteriota bacterium]
MGNVNTAEKNGKEIVLVDFSGEKAEKVPGIIEEAAKIIRNKPENTVLTLTNVKNTLYNSETVKQFNDFVKGNKPYVKAGAVIGLSKVKTVILNAINQAAGRNIKAFTDEEEALEWLGMQ